MNNKDTIGDNNMHAFFDKKEKINVGILQSFKLTDIYQANMKDTEHNQDARQVAFRTCVKGYQILLAY